VAEEETAAGRIGHAKGTEIKKRWWHPCAGLMGLRPACFAPRTWGPAAGALRGVCFSREAGPLTGSSSHQDPPENGSSRGPTLAAFWRQHWAASRAIWVEPVAPRRPGVAALSGKPGARPRGARSGRGGPDPARPVKTRETVERAQGPSRPGTKGPGLRSRPAREHAPAGNLRRPSPRCPGRAGPWPAPRHRGFLPRTRAASGPAAPDRAPPRPRAPRSRTRARRPGRPCATGSTRIAQLRAQDVRHNAGHGGQGWPFQGPGKSRGRPARRRQANPAPKSQQRAQVPVWRTCRASAIYLADPPVIRVLACSSPRRLPPRTCPPPRKGLVTAPSAASGCGPSAPTVVRPAVGFECPGMPTTRAARNTDRPRPRSCCAHTKCPAGSGTDSSGGKPVQPP